MTVDDCDYIIINDDEAVEFLLKNDYFSTHSRMLGYNLLFEYILIKDKTYEPISTIDLLENHSSIKSFKISKISDILNDKRRKKITTLLIENICEKNNR